jgi:hypothetical protein
MAPIALRSASKIHRDSACPAKNSSSVTAGFRPGRLGRQRSRIVV